ncbi:acetyltransferase [Pontimicrobium sp. MEBiC06410]
MSKQVFLYGASGHSKVIINTLELLGISIARIFDDDLNKKELLSYKVNRFNKLLIQNIPCIISIGNNIIRKKIAENYKELKFLSINHPSAIIDKSVNIGEGTVVMAGVVVNSSSIIGKHCIINTTASIDHDCLINDFVHISPNATLCGNVTVGQCSQIGAGSVIIQGVTIGDNVIVGAGSVVLEDVPNDTIVVGNPAKPINKK